MPKRWLILGILALAILAALILALAPQHQPRYAGRPLSEWMQRIMVYDAGSPLPRRDKMAAEAISHIGTNALPHLLAWIRSAQEPLWRSNLRQWTMRLPARIRPLWAYIEFPPRPELVREAFGILGSQARSAAPELTRLANDTNDCATASEAMGALAQLGNDALPPLLALLTNQNKSLRYSATLALFYQGTNGRPAVPTLLQFLNGPDPALSDAARFSLFFIAPEAVTNAPPK